MNHDELKKIQGSKADTAVAAIAHMAAPELDELARLEAAAGSPRAAVTDAIAARHTALQQAPPADDAPVATKGDAQPAAEDPEWQKPNYAGALTITQAAWRNSNIKPASAKTK